MAFSDRKVLRKESIPLSFVVEMLRTKMQMDITPLNDVPLESRIVVEHTIHRPGLVLAGYDELFQYQRVQILGNTECRYLHSFQGDARREVFARLLHFDVPVVFLTDGNTLPDDLTEMATARGIPILTTSTITTTFLIKIGDFLEDQFAQQTSVHASLVDVYGCGLLLMGRSGIGKSEVALDLVERGHRLVADDVVVASRKTDIVIGTGTDLVQHFMEIRGLGLIDVRAMFGIRAIRFQKRIEIVVHMMQWDDGEEYTRLGMVDDTFDLLGVPLPLVKLPITPGKNVTVICEVIAMNYLLRHYGYDAAEVFSQRLADHIRTRGSQSGPPIRATEYFEGDTE